MLTNLSFFKHLLASIGVYASLALLLFAYNVDYGYASHFTYELLNFDSVLYNKISEEGYQQSWLTAFFPAFPFLWRTTGASSLEIALLNALIYIISLGLITQLYSLKGAAFLFIATIPSFVFMFVPYSESLFFLCGTLILFGLRKKMGILIFSGLYLSGLVRPTSFVFIGAAILAFILTEESTKNAITKSLFAILASALGILTTFLIHYWYTGELLIFFEAQKLWENYLHMPSLPFRSWGGDMITRYDALALVSGLMAGSVVLLVVCSAAMRAKIKPHADEVFSLSYLAGTTLLIVAYRDGNLYSLNRFLFATCFIISAYSFFARLYSFRLRDLVLTFLISEIIWLFFASYNHISNFMWYTFLSFYIICLLSTRHPRKHVALTASGILILVNLVFFIIFMNRYFNQQWVG